MSIGAPTKSKRLETRGYPGFGKRLKRLRRSVGYKQAYLAELLEVDQATISRWERGGQTPPPDTQQAVFAVLGPKRSDDSALRRLVMNSSDCLHLVEEASHKCLAYSASRARDWKTSQNALLGVSLWQFATEEIRAFIEDREGSFWIGTNRKGLFQLRERAVTRFAGRNMSGFSITGAAVGLGSIGLTVGSTIASSEGPGVVETGGETTTGA